MSPLLCLQALVGLIAAVTSGLVTAQISSLRLAATAERSQVELGEPVYLNVSLDNPGSSHAKALAWLDPEDGLLSIAIKDSNGNRVGYVPLTTRSRSNAVPTDLAPGDRIASSFPIFFGAEGWVFAAPGRYVVQVQYRPSLDASGVVDSHPVTVDVGRGELPATELLSGNLASLQAGMILVWRGGDHLRQGRALLDSLTAATPTSALANHYRVASAVSWSGSFKDFTVGKLRLADYALAMADLRRVDEERLPSPVRLEKYLAQAAALLALGKPSEAETALDSANQLISRNPHLQGYTTNIQSLRRAIAPPQRPR